LKILGLYFSAKFIKIGKMVKKVKQNKNLRYYPEKWCIIFDSVLFYIEIKRRTI